MKASRILTLVIAVVLLFTMFVGCQQSRDTASEKTVTTDTNPTVASTASTAEKPKEIKTYTAFVNGPALISGDDWDTPVGKKITELSGVKLIVDRPVGSDTRQKAGVMIASGDYPDLIWGGEAMGEFQAAQALVPLNDLIDKYGTNIKKSYRPSELNLLKQKDGNIYFIGTLRASVDNLYPAAGFYLTRDALEQQGWPKIKTLSQYKQAIRDYVKKNPETNGVANIGFSLTTEGSRISSLQYGCPRYLSGSPNDGVTVIDPNTFQAKVVLTQDFNLEYLKFMNEFWKEGLLDKEIFMQTTEQYNAKISAGRFVGFFDQRWSINNALIAVDQQKMYDKVPVALPIVFDNVTQERYQGPLSFATSNGIAISIKAKDPDGIMQFLDWTCAEDATKLYYWGVENVDYIVKDGKLAKTDEQWANFNSPEYNNKQGIGIFQYLPVREGLANDFGKLSDGSWVNPKNTDEYIRLKYRPDEKEILNAYSIKTFNDLFAPNYPATYEVGWSLRSKLQSDHPGKIAIEKALETSTQYIPKIIMAKTQDNFNNLWNEYQGKLAKLDLKAYEDAISQMAKDGSVYYKN